ncbi:MAG: ferredoxin family protein [Elusimicrobiota bacterium]|nr:ferredoxin family protein [Elusimicrobiota bacterium]
MSSKKKKEKKVIINREFCKDCGYCINVCPDNALVKDESFNSMGYHPVKWTGKCSLCGQCYLVCPDNAVEIKEE